MLIILKSCNHPECICPHFQEWPDQRDNKAITCRNCLHFNTFHFKVGNRASTGITAKTVSGIVSNIFNKSPQSAEGTIRSEVNAGLQSEVSTGRSNLIKKPVSLIFR